MGRAEHSSKNAPFALAEIRQGLQIGLQQRSQQPAESTAKDGQQPCRLLPARQDNACPNPKHPQ
ncbi:MAG: hypothetical protein H6668_00590 [Ardenticatenaceae bacterium]|nr:hypothetical protein [Ardenticatenaceae bacterium]